VILPCTGTTPIRMLLPRSGKESCSACRKRNCGESTKLMGFTYCEARVAQPHG